MASSLLEANSRSADDQPKKERKNISIIDLKETLSEKRELNR